MKAVLRSKRLLGATLIGLVALNLVFASLFRYFIHDKGRKDHLSTKIHILLGQMASTQLTADDVVFLGDSITAGGLWSKLCQNPHAKNRGIDGGTTKDVLNRLDSITQAKPSKIFLMIGINDLDSGRSVTAILDNYKQILSRIIAKSPETLVYVQSVLPINSAMGISLRVTNDNVVTLNTGISQLSNELGVKFIDLYSRFVNEGQLNASYTYDGTHLNGRGYLVWKEAIGPLL